MTEPRDVHTLHAMPPPLHARVRALWQYRDLLWLLTWRNITIKHKQAVLGMAWLFIQPIVSMAILTFIFGRVAALPTNGMPYVLLTLAGVLPWQLLSDALSTASGSVTSSASMITKVYFPRLVLPFSAVLANCLEGMLPCVLLPALMLWYRVPITPYVLTVPLFLLLAMVFALGCSLWLAALNVRYRDVKHLVPFALRVGFYVSPVGFSTTNVPPSWHVIFSVNPMVGVIEGCRWAIMGATTPFPYVSLGMALPMAAVLMISGLWFFLRTERAFADII